MDGPFRLDLHPVQVLRDNKSDVKIAGPERYKLSFDTKTFLVTCSRGTPKFSGLATTKLPKLYIVSIEAKPIYVGVTRQTIRSRFRLGFNATGESGYHGYAWRHKFKEAVLAIWCHEDPLTENPERDIETVEAEVVFLARCAGQWPEGQTEIHFHPSTEEHRRVAADVWRAVTSPIFDSELTETK